MDPALVDRIWERDVLPALTDYTRIPCLSPAYDPGWEAHGHLAAATRLLADWCAARPLPGLVVDVVAPPGRTPVLLAELAGTVPGTVLVYGHLDKQPPQGTWREGLGPFEPVRHGDRLYGRGTADDGYAVFAGLVALEALLSEGGARPRVVVLVEASEESGSPDLPGHLRDLAPRLGRPDLVVCLDSGCLTYDRLWCTSSLRGNLVATVTVEVLSEGVHSGLAGGVVPSSFRLLRRLLSRVEDEATGRILLPGLQAEVPAAHRAAAATVGAELPDVLTAELPTVPGLVLGGASAAERLLAKSWAPSLAFVGVDGVPPVRDAGNVLRPFTTAKLSVRLPPTVDAEGAGAALVAALTADPPEGARVAAEIEAAAPGWVAPEPEPWVAEALATASDRCFGRPAASYGEGGTIPFLPFLAAQFPGIQLVATGVLGPASNAHGPNEFLHVPMAKAVTVAVGELLAAAGRRAGG